MGEEQSLLWLWFTGFRLCNLHIKLMLLCNLCPTEKSSISQVSVWVCMVGLLRIIQLYLLQRLIWPCTYGGSKLDFSVEQICSKVDSFPSQFTLPQLTTLVWPKSYRLHSSLPQKSPYYSLQCYRSLCNEIKVQLNTAWESTVLRITVYEITLLYLSDGTSYQLLIYLYHTGYSTKDDTRYFFQLQLYHTRFSFGAGTKYHPGRLHYCTIQCTSALNGTVLHFRC